LLHLAKIKKALLANEVADCLSECNLVLYCDLSMLSAKLLTLLTWVVQICLHFAPQQSKEWKLTCARLAIELEGESSFGNVSYKSGKIKSFLPQKGKSF
jgi:hypothetical protein